jgi:membrane protease YdiL (CAAX protease family)
LALGRRDGRLGAVAPAIAAPVLLVRPTYGIAAVSWDCALLLVFAVVGGAVWAALFPPLAVLGSHFAQLVAALLLLRLAGLHIPSCGIGRGQAGSVWPPVVLAGAPFVVLAVLSTVADVRSSGDNLVQQSVLALERVRGFPAAELGLLAFYNVVLVAVAEELVFRGYFHARLRRAVPGHFALGQLHLSRAAVASGCLFAGFHVIGFLPGHLSPGLALAPGAATGVVLIPLAFGIAAAWLYDRTGTLAGPIVIHGLFNGIGYFGRAVLLVLLAGRGG